MLTISGLALLGGIWLSPTCPGSLQISNATVGAISNSTELQLCVRKATLITGSDGSLKLILNAAAAKPSCLIYPNGLSPDLSYDLLTNGYTGCWSLYPPSQPIALVNIGSPSRQQIAGALKSFKPARPRILVKPSQDLQVADRLYFSTTARAHTVTCKMLTLNCQVRFTPKSYLWRIDQTKSKLAKPNFLLSQPGWLAVSLAVSYGVEYRFVGLTNWSTVRPGIISNAPPLQLKIALIPTEPPRARIPRLVDKPCGNTPRWGC